MPVPRYTQIDIEATPYYHCISRCVRRAFLCGRDRLTDKSFDHRKGWIVEKLADLCAVIFACAFVRMGCFPPISTWF
jgi:putative transposase